MSDVAAPKEPEEPCIASVDSVSRTLAFITISSLLIERMSAIRVAVGGVSKTASHTDVYTLTTDEKPAITAYSLEWQV